MEKYTQNYSVMVDLLWFLKLLKVIDYNHTVDIAAQIAAREAMSP
jgi:hypothetical protein